MKNATMTREEALKLLANLKYLQSVFTFDTPAGKYRVRIAGKMRQMGGQTIYILRNWDLVCKFEGIGGNANKSKAEHYLLEYFEKMEQEEWDKVKHYPDNQEIEGDWLSAYLRKDEWENKSDGY